MLTSYFINYGIFSAMLSLLLVETGASVLVLLDYQKYIERVLKYIVPIWEINGTFVAFYLVNLEATYPYMVKLIGTIYIAPVLAGLIIFMAHNAYLAYSEYIEKEEPKKLYMKIYSISMVVVAFIAVSILTSAVSGIGINTATMSISLLTMFVNGFNILMFIGIVFITLSATLMFFNARLLGTDLAPVLLAAIGIVLVGVASLIYVPYITGNFSRLYVYIIPAVVLLLLAAMLNLGSHRRLTRIATVSFLLYAMMYFGVLQYPFFFGKTINADSILNSSALVPYVNWVTLLGGIFLITILTAFAYYTYLKPGDGFQAGAEN